jgi:hypothetical protein
VLQTLGVLFMTLLLVLNIEDLSEIVARSASPIATTVILFAGTYFAFGAAITGFHFVVVEASPHE